MSAQLPGEDKSEIVVQLCLNALLRLDGYHEIDLNKLVEAQSTVKAGRLIKILDDSGQPYVLDLVSKKISVINYFLDSCTFRTRISYQLVDRCTLLWLVVQQMVTIPVCFNYVKRMEKVATLLLALSNGTALNNKRSRTSSV